MKFLRTILFVFVLVFALSCASAALAQEATPEAPIVVVPPDVETPDVIVVTPEPEGMPENVQVAIVFGVASVIGVAIVGYAYVKGKKPDELYWQLPGLATNVGVPAVWGLLMERARRTADPMDDEALKSLAATLGYVVTTLEDGRMVLSKRVTPL